jgi:hypothetical protein
MESRGRGLTTEMLTLAAEAVHLKPHWVHPPAFIARPLAGAAKRRCPRSSSANLKRAHARADKRRGEARYVALAGGPPPRANPSRPLPRPPPRQPRDMLMRRGSPAIPGPIPPDHMTRPLQRGVRCSLHGRIVPVFPPQLKPVP